ncbi:MAG: Ig domain-containing protein, partial [Terriglobales bacterium]
TGPFTPLVLNGSLPAGLSITANQSSTLTVLIQGTPSAAGSSNFTLQFTDADGQVLTQPYTLVVDPFELTPPVLTSAVEGRGYLQTLGAQGGAAPYTFHVVLGALPAGLALNSDTGDLSGVPASGTAGTSTFTVQAQDANGLIANQSYNLAVFNSTNFAITTAALPPAQAGQNYQQTLIADFGTTPYRFALLRGTLPAGVSLDAGGTLAGVPGATAAGSYAFVVQASDGLGHQASANLTLTVLPPDSPH